MSDENKPPQENETAKLEEAVNQSLATMMKLVEDVQAPLGSPGTASDWAAVCRGRVQKAYTVGHLSGSASVLVEALRSQGAWTDDKAAEMQGRLKAAFHNPQGRRG